VKSFVGDTVLGLERKNGAKIAIKYGKISLYPLKIRFFSTKKDGWGV
jgi:hypothetical protein